MQNTPTIKLQHLVWSIMSFHFIILRITLIPHLNNRQKNFGISDQYLSIIKNKIKTILG